MGFGSGLGRRCLCSGRLRGGPGAIDFSSELLDLASQQGKGQVKGGAEEPELLLGEGRGSGGGSRGGELEGAEERLITPVRNWPGKVGLKQRADPRGIQAIVHPDLNLSSKGSEEGDEGMRTNRGGIHS